MKQRWLRDVLWDHLCDEALKPAGKGPTAQTIYYRLGGIGLLSAVLEQNRADRDENQQALGKPTRKRSIAACEQEVDEEFCGAGFSFEGGPVTDVVDGLDGGVVLVDGEAAG